MEDKMTDKNTQDKPALPPKKFNLKKLGLFLDGWSELVEGMGTKAEQVRDAVLKDLKGRNMPNINILKRTGYVDPVSHDKRAYVITKTQPGATTTIYVAEHGQDLYVSWRTYIKPVLNIVVLTLIGIAALIFGMIVADNNLYGSFGLFLFTFIIMLFIGAMFVAMAGYFFRGNPLAFFYVEVTVLDAEDITAMSLSVHKSILRSLDQAGIDTSKLRIKEKFTGGRKGEDI
jgi:hypothetical protein